jgi:hypothetical protein
MKKSIPLNPFSKKQLLDKIFDKPEIIPDQKSEKKSEPVAESKIEIKKLEQISQPEEDNYKKLKDEFQNFVSEKLSKVDEIWNLIKHSQISKETSNEINTLPNVQNIIKPIPKEIRTKRTYYKVTDTMWNDIKTKFTELPDSYKELSYSDGKDYFIDFKNKKTLLDNKLLLRIINMKK